jgi:hypothetical protein
MTTVEVSCRLYAPEIESVEPGGFWYRVASPPWNDTLYAPANTFWNGQTPGGPGEEVDTDLAVPLCE